MWDDDQDNGISEWALRDRLDCFYREYRQTPRAICVAAEDFGHILLIGYPAVVPDPEYDDRTTFYNIPVRVSAYVEPGKPIIDYGIG